MNAGVVEQCYYYGSHRWRVVRKEPQSVGGSPLTTDAVAWEVYRMRAENAPVLVTYRCTCGSEKVERV